MRVAGVRPDDDEPRLVVERRAGVRAEVVREAEPRLVVERLLVERAGAAARLLVGEPRLVVERLLVERAGAAERLVVARLLVARPVVEREAG